MKRPFLLQAFLAVALLSGTAPAQTPVAGRAPAHSARFVKSDAFDFAKILPAPPAAGTPAAEADLETVLQAQAWRTPEQVAWAKRIDAGDIFDFADVLGGWFNKEKLPVTTALLESVDWEIDAGVYASKKFFARPRPFVIDTRVQPCVKSPAEASYPSGHATDYFFRAGVLAEIFPDRRMELFEFARKAAWGRVLGGVHFPTDLVGGRLLAAAVVEELKKHPVFQSELKQSQAEVAAVVKR